jgi:hypothetical protein
MLSVALLVGGIVSKFVGEKVGPGTESDDMYEISVPRKKHGFNQLR